MENKKWILFVYVGMYCSSFICHKKIETLFVLSVLVATVVVVALLN
jgi:putative effector of murein hydrolase